MTEPKTTLPAIAQLLTIMAKLRDPINGCPWDQAQDFASIAPYTIEEAYEVADAIAHLDDEPGAMTHLRDELGDLLLQVVFHAQMAAELDAFDFAAVAQAISDKMIKRHPHVFGAEEFRDATAQTIAWEEQKAIERAELAATEGRAQSALDGVASALPALTRALKLQKRAARVGFDWPDTAPVLAKIDEEIAELTAEMDAGNAPAMAEEMGDLLFSVVNLARHLDIDPEAALRAGNDKFERRFRSLEADLSDQGLDPKEFDIERLEDAWTKAKISENT
ncbi:MAG: nucleoside triphosphate pyrophosphohydrolase [Rhodospirillaceae bacterium]|jgi:nucleoside triphosphate diphosphatase|nr:nucleoside triphosphate pyrophosphohydrolase [Rhodospirillaceae bacterium]MBT3493693.1 nucleoside triphosphate pyrophosphohydrolase [Rhodospirillaceae bacterium]MBT3780332.1 nucleoside triphosphate pyrophosphohydrolase [Rhodospirillaceae bacterium]MBT3978421.1 nucleoside triphosphate pyrophosphohydrolase [Rhodospirillaceae bacterium]MBT4168824.1 nucleoside triphosphate pyrophosphohydrolase [Rhodospirillaceae bacterium]